MTRHPRVAAKPSPMTIGLREKRAELSGELIATEKRIVQLRADIDSLDGAIRVFDPTSEPQKIRPILRRKKPTLIPRGQCSPAILDMLRHADGAMTARGISAQLAARYRMDTGNMEAMNAFVAKVRNTLARQKGLASHRCRHDAQQAAWPPTAHRPAESLHAPRAATGVGDLGQRSMCQGDPSLVLEARTRLTPSSGGGRRHVRAVRRDTRSPRRIRYRTPSAPASSDRRPLGGHTRSFRACRYPRFCSDWP
jgi:hypothetical protein